ncbi:MAG: hypothetical protein C5B59_12930 [Bacteroidetes bacterium]|nr:MAG: hypothetical protein C5B59_12930 [Bacteroidota bacterium]
MAKIKERKTTELGSGSNDVTSPQSFYGKDMKKNINDLHNNEEDPITRLDRHYLWGVQDMDTRRVRKNGWNDIINAYMGKLPVNWPYNSVVTVPLIRTTILEKTSRLLNSKLQGRVTPRTGGSSISAKIHNAILDFQWDAAEEGGSMLEKVSISDQRTRIFGNAWVLVYWDNKKDSNEIKVIDPRDIFIDGACTHVRNAKWIDVREFTTFDKLADRGYDVREAVAMAAAGEITAELRSVRYESIVKANRGLVDRVGWIDDLKNPVVEVVTEFGFDRKGKGYTQVWLPKYHLLLDDGPLKYKHNKLPVAQLRYYPLDDDIYGESEVESVLPLQRAANAMVCGFLDECNIKIRPPLKISATGVRIETIEYGPGAKWIMNSPNNVVELEPNGGFIAAFNSVYPMIINAYKEAMGDQSEFNQNAPSVSKSQPTATQVVTEEKQQNVRDQYNQMYLAEFLQDIMEMWISNNKQYLFDDPTKHFKILKIIGRDMIKEFQQMQLDELMIPEDAMNQVAQVVAQNPQAVTPQMMNDVIHNIMVPKNAVIENPNAKPKDQIVHNKLEVKSPTEAELYVTPEDMEGLYDYIPDVKSMAVGAGMQQQQAIQNVLNISLNPEVSALLQAQGDAIKIKDVLTQAFEQAGYKDAESLFTTTAQQGQNGQPAIPGVPGQPPQGGQPGQPPSGPGVPGPGGMAPQPPGVPGMGQVPPALPPQPSPGGIPRPF